MGSLGVTVTVRELSWTEYQNALTNGDYDMYYAEVKLGADFDLTSILTEDGSLNYGKIKDENYATYINAFLAADELTRTQPARCCQLHHHQCADHPHLLRAAGSHKPPQCDHRDEPERQQRILRH